MNGAHAELFTYCLYEELRSEAATGGLTPLKLMEYYSVNETAIEPGIRFDWSGDKMRYFELEGSKDGFVLYRTLDDDDGRPVFVDFLAAKEGFTLTKTRLGRK